MAMPQLDINNNIVIVGSIVFIFVYFYVYFDLQLFYSFFVEAVFKKIYQDVFLRFYKALKRFSSERAVQEEKQLHVCFRSLFYNN